MNTLYQYIHSKNTMWVKTNMINHKNNQKTIFKENLKVKCKEKQKLIYNKFILTKSNLILLKNNDIIGLINLNFIGIDYNKERQRITFFTNKKFFSIFFNNYDIFINWKIQLKKKAILNNFLSKYNIISKIGEGNNSAVYMANKINNGKKYAIKIISKKIINNSLLYDSFINEINILKKLNHKNIVRLKNIFETENSFYIVMNYCNNNSLLSLLKNKISFKTKINLINQIIDGWEYIHSLDIVHRDIKPENIFLHKNKKDELLVNIGDFGLSNFLNKKFIYKKCGTLGYISPEILNFKNNEKYEISDKCDIYSWGHVIFNIFTNKSIFKYNKRDDLFYLNKFNDYNINIVKDKSLIFLLKNCLYNNPEDRINLKKLKEYINVLNIN